VGIPRGGWGDLQFHTNLPHGGIWNYSALLFDLEGYAQTPFGMVMLGIIGSAAMFIIWLVGGGRR
jgi:hypothetical protein